MPVIVISVIAPAFTFDIEESAKLLYLLIILSGLLLSITLTFFLARIGLSLTLDSTFFKTFFVSALQIIRTTLDLRLFINSLKASIVADTAFFIFKIAPSSAASSRNIKSSSVPDSVITFN